MSKKIIKNLIFSLLLFIGVLSASWVFAQDFGTEAVANGLNNSLASGDPRTIAGRIINVALGLLGVIALGIVLYAGFLWMTSGGDDDKIGKAKKYLRNGVIGLIIILMSWALASFIISKLGGAISGNGCTDGETRSCGCNGVMTCNSGIWGSCVGSDCGGGPGPTSCDGDQAAPGCQAISQICAPTDYCDDQDCNCKHKGSLGDPCDSDFNNATCEPDNNRCGEYLVCNQETCLCSGSPVITGLSPVGGFCLENPDKACLVDSDCASTCDKNVPNGSTNNFITIFGKNFGTYSATSSRVVFIGNNNPQEGKQPSVLNPACIDSWRDSQIVIAVPEGVSTGPIKVVTQNNLEDVTSDTYGPLVPDFVANNISRPGLCLLSPTRGVLSSEVGYQGIKLYSGDAYFGNYQTNVRGLESVFDNQFSGTSTTPNIRTGDSSSFVVNNINGNNQKSNYLNFTKDPELGDGPYIVSFTPLVGHAGQYVTITGSGFGGARGENHVYFSNNNTDIEASYDFPEVCLNSVWKDTQIIVKVPENIPDDYYLIKIALGTTTIDTQKLNPNTFQADKSLSLKTSLCKIFPSRGPIGAPVSLWGEYFGALNSEALLSFNVNKSATGTIVKDGRADLVETIVPSEAITGPVRVIKNNEYGNELNFEIGACVIDSDCENTEVCCPANTYKKGRCANSLADCFIDVPTSVFEWSFNTGFNNSTTTPYNSCGGFSKYLGSCYQGLGCPNSPGACSSPEDTYQKVVGSCDSSCQSVPGCAAAACTYNAEIDKCVKGGCDLPQTISLGTKTVQKTCNSEGKWEILAAESCPSGWIRMPNNRCIENNSSCQICDSQFRCQSVDSLGVCVSNKLCAEVGAKCLADNCVIEEEPSCECCCRIGYDQEDCCAGLKCDGRCGSDLATNSSVGTCCDNAGNCINPNCSAWGGVVAEIGGYCLHTFKNSGTLEVNTPINAMILVVGGGGGAGGGEKNVVYDAGGGGGQVKEESLVLPVGLISVEVGNAGVSGTLNTNTDGGNSSFFGVQASGGKRATWPGTGGMSSARTGGSRNGFGSGGGAGDGQNGFNAPTNEIGGDGGSGTYSNITGVSLAYGGGGEGNSFITPGTGGAGYKNPGGGGSGQTGAAGNEAQSGVVIVKYPATPATSCPSGYSASTNTYGNCTGCALLGSTTAERDAACNCSGHGGKYCDITAEHPEGVCADCSSITGLDIESAQVNCGDHSMSCCFDSNKTVSVTDDFCRGVNGSTVISNLESSPDYGYCAYYNCQAEPENPSLCASSTPERVAYYNTIEKCEQGCAANPGTDLCSLFNNNQLACMAQESCCFDKKTSNCRGGDKIASGQDAGFCAYYNCRLDNPKLCDFNPSATGLFSSVSTCISRCANENGGAGLSCAGNATSSCETEICNLPGFGCLTSSGAQGNSPDCGACCCEPGQTPDTCISPSTPNLRCQPDRGNCTGAGRGLCCGCSKDSDCGYPNSIGCGSDTCCEARPKIISTEPAHLENGICRNTVLKVNFDQLMDISSFGGNLLLLEERDYGNGTCPPGTFITRLDDLNQGWIKSSYNKLKLAWQRLGSRLSGRLMEGAIANPPDPNKLYCAIPGSLSSETNGDKTTLVYAPQGLLSAATNYYLVIKGDENLNSQTGVLSLKNIGFNGEGYFDPISGAYLEGEFLKFNKKSYKNSQIIKFTTLSEQSSQSGVCLVDQVKISPASYLFKTTNNDLNENDSDPNNRTFDTKIDKDKVFAAWAYSDSGQVLQPVTGYFWDWNFSVNNTAVVGINPVNGLANNKKLLAAQSGITDSETFLTATINMDRFMLSGGCNSAPNCSCQDAVCSDNCCNAFSNGNNFGKTSNLYVFICSNPWPPVDGNGNWSPWSDNCQGAIGGACSNYNYKFYYCRDFGNNTTLDDLPAIIKQPIIRGESSNFVCSSDRNPCSSNEAGLPCGLDQNGDGTPDGLCVWNVLKESYFFREALPQSGFVLAATDQLIGRTVKVEWQASTNQGAVYSFKIYYLKSGKGNMMVKEVLPANACVVNGNVYECSALVDNLTNGTPYVFKVSVISVNRTESSLSNEKTAIPSDKTPPPIPVGLQGNLFNPNTVKFIWGAVQIDPDAGETVFYRLYHGLSSGQFGESFDSIIGGTSLAFNKSQFPAGNNYFAISAIDNYGNESARSAEIMLEIPSD